MKEYKMVCLNKGLRFSRERDVAAAEATLNKYIAEGWELEEILAPGDLMGTLIAVLYKEK